jgi:hypothetical protein
VHLARLKVSIEQELARSVLSRNSVPPGFDLQELSTGTLGTPEGFSRNLEELPRSVLSRNRVLIGLVFDIGLGGLL